MDQKRPNHRCDQTCPTEIRKTSEFLTFGECVDRINQHLLLNQSIRAPENGEDNGVRLTSMLMDFLMF